MISALVMSFSNILRESFFLLNKRRIFTSHPNFLYTCRKADEYTGRSLLAVGINKTFGFFLLLSLTMNLSIITVSPKRNKPPPMGIILRTMSDVASFLDFILTGGPGEN